MEFSSLIVDKCELTSQSVLVTWRLVGIRRREGAILLVNDDDDSLLQPVRVQLSLQVRCSIRPSVRQALFGLVENCRSPNTF